jgi:hypothetical protein
MFEVGSWDSGRILSFLAIEIYRFWMHLKAHFSLPTVPTSSSIRHRIQPTNRPHTHPPSQTTTTTPASINNILPPRLLNPTPRPIHHLNLLLPNRLIPPLDQIPHISIRTIARAAFDSRIPPVSELVKVVLDAPVLAPLRRVAFADLAGEDFVGRGVVGCAHDVAFGGAELGFAHCGC